MISHCLWQIYIRLCLFHFFQHHLSTFTFTHLKDSYHDISRNCVILLWRFETTDGTVQSMQWWRRAKSWFQMGRINIRAKLAHGQNVQGVWKRGTFHWHYETHWGKSFGRSVHSFQPLWQIFQVKKWFQHFKNNSKSTLLSFQDKKGLGNPQQLVPSVLVWPLNTQ